MCVEVCVDRERPCFLRGEYKACEALMFLSLKFFLITILCIRKYRPNTRKKMKFTFFIFFLYVCIVFYIIKVVIVLVIVANVFFFGRHLKCYAFVLSFNPSVNLYDRC